MDPRFDIRHVAQHVETIIDKGRDPQALANSGFLRPFSAEMHMAPLEAGARVKVVMLEPIERLSLHVGTAFRNDIHVLAKALIAKAADRFDRAFEHLRCEIIVREKGGVPLRFGRLDNHPAYVNSECVFHI